MIGFTRESLAGFAAPVAGIAMMFLHAVSVQAEKLPANCGPLMPFDMKSICKGEPCGKLELQVHRGFDMKQCFYLKSYADKGIKLHMRINGEASEGYIPRENVSPRWPYRRW